MYNRHYQKLWLLIVIFLLFTNSSHPINAAQIKDVAQDASIAPLSMQDIRARFPNRQQAAPAEWTVLAYMDGDTNIEAGLLNDFDEFERAGGSTEKVRVIALVDRHPEYDESNGNWTDTRLYEVGPDTSNDYETIFPATIDSTKMANMGELDMGAPGTLQAFLEWGIEHYPAKRYAIVFNDHGGAASGMIQDETSGNMLNPVELQQALSGALTKINLSKFDLILNDLCLMSSLEFYAAIAPYADTAVSSPEVTLDPSMDNTLLIKLLNENPDMPLNEIGQAIVDKYMHDMAVGNSTAVKNLGMAVTKLDKVPAIAEAVENFASIVNAKPEAYTPLIGAVMARTYLYAEWKQSGRSTIDLGNFMTLVASRSKNQDLVAAANNVLDKINEAVIYGQAGQSLLKKTSFFKHRPAANRCSGKRGSSACQSTQELDKDGY